MNDRIYIDTIERGDGVYTVGGAFIEAFGPSKNFKADIDEDVMEYICEEVVLHLDSTGFTDAVVDATTDAVLARLRGEAQKPGIISEEEAVDGSTT